MKIVYITETLNSHGGIERILHTKASSLVEKGIDVHIITLFQYGEKLIFDFPTEVKHYDIGVKMGRDRKKSYGQYRKYLKSQREVLNDVLCSIAPDITIFMGIPEMTNVCVPDFYTDGSYKVLEAHNSKYANFENARQRLKSLKLFIQLLKVTKVHYFTHIRNAKKVDKVVLLTQEDKKQWYELSNAVVIPNFSKEYNRQEQNVDYSIKRAIAVGRISTQKRFDRLIAAWSIVAKQYPDWQLSIFGDGPKDKLQMQIDALGLSNKVVLEGVTNDVCGEMQKNSIYVMSSSYEGMPMVLLEAMQCRLPIVSFACPCGPRDLVDHNKTGILVDNVKDIEGLANGIIKLMQSEDLRQEMGEAGYEKSKQFGKEIIVDRWIELFNELIAKKSH